MNASYKTAIQFSNLYIPVKLIKVSHDISIELNQLCKDSKERVRYRKYCPSCDKEITNEDIVKGYCYAENRYVILEQSDIESITTDQDKTLKIEYFCKSKEISDLLFDKSYYVIPEMDGEEQYNLLRKAMISNMVVGIAEIVLGTKQELVALFANKATNSCFVPRTISAIPTTLLEIIAFLSRLYCSSPLISGMT